MNMAKNMTNYKKSGSSNAGKKGYSRSDAGRVVTIRVLILVLFNIVMGSLFDYIIHAGNNIELVFYKDVRPVLLWVSIALFVLSAAYVIAAKVKKIDTSRHPITPEMLAALTLILMATVLLYNTFRLTPFLFFTMMIVISILVAVYYIYTMLFY